MVEVVRSAVVSEINRFVRQIKWTGLLNTDSGNAIDLPRFSDKTVHIFGTFGGATVTLYGSNDPLALVDKNAGTLFGSKTASWVKLTETLGNDLAVTAAALKIILEDPLYILPVVTAGDGTTTISVIIECKKEFA